MFRQIRKLVGVTLCNTWGINVARYSNDKKKKRNVIMMALLFLLLACIGITYVALLAHGFIAIGLADIIPSYILMLTSLVILVFSILKAGNILFQMKTYDMLISMPIKPTTIVVSRFLCMYMGNMALSVLTIVPSTIVYGINQKPGGSFYLMMAISIFLLPLIPMTIATAIGALVIAIGSRLKHKNLVTIILSILLTMGIVVGSFCMPSDSAAMTQALTDISTVISDQVNRIYPLAKLFTKAVIENNLGAFLVFALISIGVFLLFVAIVQWKFVSICSAINARNTKNNYVISDMKASSAMMGLYKKELRRYFSSSIYVLNTMIGYVMMLAFSIGLFVMGIDKLEKTLQMPSIISKGLPIILSMFCCILPTTVSSISLEGKQWWIPLSMPIKTKTILDSKILVNLTIAAPFLIISEVLTLFSLKTTLAGYVITLIVPIVYVVYVAVIGITINLKMPNFNWETEVTVIKQSGASSICLLVTMISIGLPALLMVLLRELNSNLILGGMALVICIFTAILYKYNIAQDLKQL